jgi:hypothetical protein
MISIKIKLTKKKIIDLTNIIIKLNDLRNIDIRKLTHF